MLAMALICGALPGIIGGFDQGPDEPMKIAAPEPLVSELAKLKGFAVQSVGSASAAERAVRDGKVEAAVIQDADVPSGLAVIAKEDPPSGLVSALTVTPDVRLLDPPAVAQFVKQLAAMVFAVMFFVLIMMYGQTAAQNTVVEKQTRVVEILLAAVPARVLLAGKILSNAVLAFATVAGLIAAVSLGAWVSGSWAAVSAEASVFLPTAGGASPLAMVSGSLGWFLLFFVVAFVMFSSLMVGSAATVSRLEEIGSVLTPTMMLAMIPYFLVIMFNDSEVVLDWLSYIPFSSPTAMPLRIVTGEAAWWEPVIALVILAVTTVLAIVLAGKLFENSILRTGARIRFKDAFSTRV
jgi:ABC-2 type transport system permease protein